MKSIAKISLTAAALVFGGCVSRRETMVQESVGPFSAVDVPVETFGYLMVYSAYDPSGSVDPETNRHTAYRIYSVNKELLKTVSNYTRTNGENPDIVSLAAGQYVVVARAAGRGIVTVPVVVETSKTTTLFLDGSGQDLASTRPAGALVRFPDGEVIGWRARTDPTEK